MVSGTLGLAYPVTNKALNTALNIVSKNDKSKIIIDVNWRPVFFNINENKVKQEIFEFVSKANFIKMTDEEAEWLLGIPHADALSHPNQVFYFNLIFF